MFLSDLISAKDLIRFRNTHPSEEWIKAQDERLRGIYVQYVEVLTIEMMRQDRGAETGEAIQHALVTISAIDYLIHKVTEGPTQ